jgi:hypothetical protein
MRKVMGMKGTGIGGSFTFRVKWWVRGGKVSSNIHLGEDMGSEVFKMGEWSYFRVSIFSSMVECIFLLMVVILKLSLHTSF